MKKRVRTKAEDKFRHELALEKEKETKKKKSKKKAKPSRQKAEQIKEASSVAPGAASVTGVIGAPNELMLLMVDKSNIEPSQVSNEGATEEVIEESITQDSNAGKNLSQDDILAQLQSNGVSFQNQTTENVLASLNILNKNNTVSSGLVGELLKQYLENQKKAIDGLMAQLLQRNLVQGSSELIRQIAAQSAVPDLTSVLQLMQQSQAQRSSNLTSQIVPQPLGLDLNSLISVQNTEITSPNLGDLLRLNSHESKTPRHQEASKNLSRVTFDMPTVEQVTTTDTQTVNDSEKEEHSSENDYIVQDDEIAMDSFDIREQPNEKDCNMEDDDGDDCQDLLDIVRPRTPAPDLSNIPDDNEFAENLANDNKTKQELDLYKQDSDGDT